MQERKNSSFFDPKTLIAVAVVAVFYYGWQSYLTKKYPGYGQVKNTPAEVAQTTSASDSSEAGEATVQTSNPEHKSESVKAVSAQIFEYSDEKVAFKITNVGMGLRDFTIKSYLDKEKQNPIQLGVSETQSIFAMKWVGDTSAIHFDMQEQAPGHYVGVAQVGETSIKREIKYNPENYSFSNTVTFSGTQEEVKKGFVLTIPEVIHETGGGSFFMPSYDHQDFFITHAGSSETVNFSNASESFSKEFQQTSLISVSSQYFTAAILDKSETIPEVKVSADIHGKTVLAELIYKPVQTKNETVFSEIFYAGPKSIDILKAVDPELAGLIDLGFFDFIGRPLLYVMKAFHSVVGNWGIAIILLTLLVRLCVLPFNIMSFRSMKAMQKVQPIIQSLREKYKDDPMRLNQEMMSVMKQNGANPLGGCLPMLLQIPVFFALFRVIGSSVELYNSPFMLWITDLSSHDKFYVLPVIVAVLMYIQQKITPSTMDPTQAKIMAFMPVLFSVFMLQLPSGLSLYMVVSTLFGVVQQYMIMREKKPA